MNGNSLRLAVVPQVLAITLAPGNNLRLAIVGAWHLLCARQWFAPGNGSRPAMVRARQWFAPVNSLLLAVLPRL
jgi:hypothetical protein